MTDSDRPTALLKATTPSTVNYVLTVALINTNNTDTFQSWRRTWTPTYHRATVPIHSCSLSFSLSPPPPSPADITRPHRTWNIQTHCNCVPEREVHFPHSPAGEGDLGATAREAFPWAVTRFRLFSASLSHLSLSLSLLLSRCLLLSLSLALSSLSRMHARPLAVAYGLVASSVRASGRRYGVHREDVVHGRQQDVPRTWALSAVAAQARSSSVASMVCIPIWYSIDIYTRSL